MSDRKLLPLIAFSATLSLRRSCQCHADVMPMSCGCQAGLTSHENVGGEGGCAELRQSLMLRLACTVAFSWVCMAACPLPAAVAALLMSASGQWEKVFLVPIRSVMGVVMKIG